MSMVDLDLSFYFSGFKAKSKSVSAVVNSAKDVYGMEHSSMLGGQLFNALYQKDPHLQTVDDPNNKYAQAIRAVLKSGQFLKLRNQTAGSLSWSAIGAAILVDELAKKIQWQDQPKPETKEPPPPSNDEEGEPQGGDDSEEESKGEGKSEDGEPSEDTEDNKDGESQDESDDKSKESSDENSNKSGKPTDSEDNDIGDESSESSEESDEGGDDSNDESDEGDGDDSSDTDDTSGEGETDSEPVLDEQRNNPVDIDIQRAVNEAGEKLDNMMVGLSPGAGESEETFNDAIDLADLYTGLAHNDGLSELIQLVGKLRLNTSFLPAMTVGEPEEVSEVELGDELEKVLPSDMGLMFGTDEENFTFMHRLENKELVQYRTVTHKQPGMGPMVVCLDASGSMSYAMSGSQHTRDEWAKSLAIAVYIQAMKENRPYALVNFSSYASLSKPSQMNRIDPEFLKRVQDRYASGGTDFGAAWNKAINFITEDREGRDFRDADIVFITDGQGGFFKEYIERSKEENNIRLVTIFLGSNMKRGMGQGLIGEWAELSDAMAFVDKLSDKTEAEAFRIIKNHEITGVKDI